MNDTTPHKAPFRLAPAEPDLGQLILQARDEVVEDNNLSLGARLMFVRILDLSVRQASNVRPGVVTISQMKLACKFGVSERTIWAWRSELIRAKYVWLSKQYMPNSWPIDTYHVSIIHPPANTGDKTTVEGLWGNGARRGEPTRGMGARQPGQTQIPGTGVRRKGLRLAKSFNVPVKSSVLLENATADRSELRASTEADCDGGPKQAAAPNRSGLRLATEADCDGPPKPFAAPNRSQLRPTTEADCEHIKAQGQGSSHIEGVKGSSDGSPAPDLELERFKNRLEGMYDSKVLSLEKEIRGKLDLAKTPASREHWKARLAAIKAHRLGGLPPEETKPATVKRVATSTATTQKLPDEKIRELGKRAVEQMRKAVAV